MRFYCLHSSERFKPASQADFLQLVDKIHQDQWYKSLIENVVMQTGECDSYVEDVLDMTMKHLNRILTHGLVKFKLNSKLKNKSKFSKALRDELKSLRT